MRCILVLGGPRDEWLPEPPEQRDGDLVVACDGGYPAAVECGLQPALAVGDFDSYRGDIAPGVEVITAPPMRTTRMPQWARGSPWNGAATIF